MAFSFDLDNDPIESNQIGDVLLVQSMVLILNRNLFLRCEWNLLISKLDFNGLLINAFEKSTTKSLVDFKSGTHDLVHLILID